MLPPSTPEVVASELRKSAFCGHIHTPSDFIPDDITAFKSWNDLVDATAHNLHCTQTPPSNPPERAEIRAALRGESVTDEVLRTVLTEVEEILNAKPLGYVSSDVSDPDPVTPNLLLMGRLDASLPQDMYRDSELLSNRRWRHSLADHFWTQYIKYYLPTLQLRQKWLTDNPNLAISTVVMVIDPQLPQALWPIGRIQRLLPSPDGKVRVVEVNIKGRTYKRPVCRLIALPAIPEDDTTLPDAPHGNQI